MAGRSLKPAAFRKPFVKRLSSAFIPGQLHCCSFPLLLSAYLWLDTSSWIETEWKLEKLAASLSSEAAAAKSHLPAELESGRGCSVQVRFTLLTAGWWTGWSNRLFILWHRRDWLAWKLTLSLQLSLKAPNRGLPAGNLRLRVKNGRGNGLVFLTFNISKN